MKSYSFSVVIPLYNKAPYICRAIDSVLRQTLKPVEIIVIDDCSTDGGPDKVAAYADTRIRIVNRDVPGPGGYAARNLGVLQATGEWIAFLDADDEWHPGHLEHMSMLVKKISEGACCKQCTQF